MKILFVYPRFQRHAESNPGLREVVPMKEYLGSPSLGIAAIAAMTPKDWTVEFRDDRIEAADRPTDADIVALSFFTPAAKRGLELADYFRSEGRTVVAGGIFPTMMPEVVEPHVDAVVVGEGEGVWFELLGDFVEHKRLKSLYRADANLDLEGLPLPDVRVYLEKESPVLPPDDYPVQISRGCALSCQACVLPYSMTRNLRLFSLSHVVGQMEQLSKAGKRACLTEDTAWFPGSSGRRLMGSLFDYLAERPGDALISYVGISMPMILSTKPAFFERAKAAGVNMFYLVGGFDPISMRAFTGDDPMALQKAEDSIAKAWDMGIEPYTSFLLGGDQDDVGTVDRMLEFANRTKIRKAEFAVFTPYPGTPSWHRLLKEDRILTQDWSKYNDANVVFRPAKMTPDQLHEGYMRLWTEFYRERMSLSSLSDAERTIQF